MNQPSDLIELQRAWEKAARNFQALLAVRFPAADKWTWYRAIAASQSKDVRRNEDTSRDAAMASDADIRAAHDEYVRLLHVFYRARDGENGFLGERNAP